MTGVCVVVTGLTGRDWLMCSHFARAWQARAPVGERRVGGGRLLGEGFRSCLTESVYYRFAKVDSRTNSSTYLLY